MARAGGVTTIVFPPTPDLYGLCLAVVAGFVVLALVYAITSLD